MNEMPERIAAELAPAEAPDDLDLFIRALRGLAGKTGNKALRDNLGWDEDRYWQAHGRALDSGQVISARGRGGSVRFATPDAPAAIEAEVAPVEFGAQEEIPAAIAREADLYPDAMRVIQNSWVKSANYDDHLIEITASKGKAATGGKWSRPDISILATKAFPYLPSRLFDIVTFEIKPAGQTTVEGVFEALSHRQFANRAYVIFHMNDLDVAEHFAEKQPYADRILGIARKHGVGVIIATDVADWETWDELVPAERGKPDPEQANRFIATCFSEQNREQIIKWHK